MIRFLFRFLGVVVLAAAFVALLYDGTKTIADGEITATRPVEIWSYLHPESLKRAQAFVEKETAPWIWERVAVPVLTAPAELVLGIIGILLMLIGRRPRPKIGYARR